MLGRFPLIDGHNDLPWALRGRTEEEGGDLSQVVFDLESPATGLHTDVPRLAAGGVGAQFWSVYVPASLAGRPASRPRRPVAAWTRGTWTSCSASRPSGSSPTRGPGRRWRRSPTTSSTSARWRASSTSAWA